MARFILLAFFVLAFLTFACQEKATPSNTALEAVRDYVTTTGLDGQTFQFTEPNDCDAVEDIGATFGKVCIDLADSQLGETSAAVEVGVYGTEAVWKLTLALQDDTWVVTNVEYVGL